ncbi:hypothetical protein B0H14DRAFT_3861164 [Mycena olivaceomarginata]|nr:hypothetical protein B0H14DRAFT_3861164 [Mycena olivaceomarginata]
MADYAYTFKAPPQHHYGYHSQAYISPTSSSPSSNLSINGGTSTNNPIAPPTALLWTEPWMDAEYACQVCALMRWDAGVLIPPPSTPSHGFSSNAANGPNATHPNNAGYAVLSFASARAAAAALAQVSAQMMMPNSARPFVLNWGPPGVGGAASSGSQSSANTTTNGGSGPAGSNSGNATSTLIDMWRHAAIFGQGGVVDTAR